MTGGKNQKWKTCKVDKLQKGEEEKEESSKEEEEKFRGKSETQRDGIGTVWY